MIVVEDIVETGATLENILDELKTREVGSVKVATLLVKPNAFKKNIKLDYVGFEIPNNYVIGYGLDYEGYGRNLSPVYKMVE